MACSLFGRKPSKDRASRIGGYTFLAELCCFCVGTKLMMVEEHSSRVVRGVLRSKAGAMA